MGSVSGCGDLYRSLLSHRTVPHPNGCCRLKLNCSTRLGAFAGARPMLDLRAHFSRFLGAEPERLHFAAHSHHPWPDVTRNAQLAAWDDAARLQDGKWETVLGPVWQAAQRHVARHLALPNPATLVF